MTNDEYLQAVLASQTLDEEGPELKELRSRRKEVEQVLRDHFQESKPTIRYGGSKAKGTMIRESFDLDIICYFPRDDDEAGKTLKEIYEETQKTLQKKYHVEPKGVALRVRGGQKENYRVDFHIDVVPGRFTDDSKTDAYLYKPSGEKGRMKTNLDIHISHVKDSGVTEAIRLLKLWRVRNALTVKIFALELIAIELLKKRKSSGLATQLKHIWTELRDRVDEISIEDPANPTGNDLSDLLDASVRAVLSGTARRTLQRIEDLGWESIFGPEETMSENDKTAALGRVAVSVSNPSKPWWGG
ncbi:MAG: nucleotidyltransferase domain-containing protein [Desulfobacteria bacterium]